MTYIEFEVSGEKALFSEPLTRVGGEKMTYSVPTYSALVGVCESIYWKPTFEWVIDSCRVMSRIKTKQYCINGRFLNSKGSNPLTRTYLIEPKYQIRAHIEWDLRHETLKQDRNFKKHYAILQRSLERGGRRPVYFGTSDCIADVEKCKFGEGEGYYDDDGIINFGIMLHSIVYSTSPDIPSEVLLWNAEMNNGIINFIRQEKCEHRRNINVWNNRQFKLAANVQPVTEFDYRKEFGDELLERSV